MKLAEESLVKSQVLNGPVTSLRHKTILLDFFSSTGKQMCNSGADSKLKERTGKGALKETPAGCKHDVFAKAETGWSAERVLI